MKKLLAILLALLLFLTACGKTTTDPVPETPPEIPVVIEPVPVEDPDPETLSYTINSTAVTKTWDTVTATINYPVLFGENLSACTTINNYYELLQGKVLDYVEGDLLSTPGATVTTNFDIMCAEDTALSMLWYVWTITDLTQPIKASYSAATFEPATGNLFTFASLFTDPAAARAKFVEKARETMEQLQNTHPLYSQWYDLADSALDTDCFYFSEDAVYVFYTPDAVGAYVAVPLSYDELGDLLKVKP